VAALALQYPAGRLADRIGRRPVLIGGLLCYGAASVAFLLPVSPVGDIALRAAQGAGAGAAEVASLAMISAAVSIERRGRAFSSIYSGQLGGMAVGPLIGSLIGVSSMSIIFLVAGVMSVLACIPVLADADLAQHGARPEDRTARLRRRLSFNRAMTGSLLAAAALGLTIGVYESTWTLLLEHRQAATWQIGLSWTLFAIPFVAFSRVGGRLADRYDRRWLVFGALIVSVGFCCLYPFVTSVWWLLLLAPIESSGFAIALPSAQSLLTQSAAPGETGRIQGLFSTSETAAIALAAATGGALFGLHIWAPYVLWGAVGALLTASVPFVWRPVAGRVSSAASRDERVRQHPRATDIAHQAP
jgi:DHA1 family multidrug resistance protein-like MFS transporter